MRKGNVTCLFGSDRMIVIDHTPPLKIAKAIAFTRACLRSDVGFCYGDVKRVALSSGSHIRNHIERLKRELNTDTTLEKHVIHRLRKLRDIRKEGK